jgi:hypothetical protein
MKYLFVFITSFIFVSGHSLAQEKKAPEKPNSTTAAIHDSTMKKETFKLMMDAIEVRGWIEKPQTIFVVPGIDPEVDDIGLDRSFANEILRPLDKDKFEKTQVREKKKAVIPW